MISLPSTPSIPVVTSPSPPPLSTPMAPPRPLLLLLLLLLLSSFPFSTPSDTLPLGHSLPGNATIVSERGLFELGLFSPGASRKYYLGIWYKNVAKKTIVWVANRETPLSDTTTSELRLSERGILLLTTNNSNTPIWSSSNSRTPNTTVAVLLNTGNLVLRDGSSPNGSDYLWQSFDHPTDTLLPGGKLGYNKTTGQTWKVTSWKSPDDPSPGMYTLMVDPNGGDEIFLLWNGTLRYWRSGKWDGRIFVDIPEMNALQQYGILRHDGDDGVYYWYVNRAPEGVSGLVLSMAGQINWQEWVPDENNWQVFTFLPKDACDVFHGCGAFAACVPLNHVCRCLPGFTPRSPSHWAAGVQTGGCVRSTPLACGQETTGKKDGFSEIAGVIQPPMNSTESAVRDENGCVSACFADCSCTAYAYNGTCLTWNGELFNINRASSGGGGDEGITLRLRVAAGDVSETTGAGGSGSHVITIVVAACGAALVALLVVAGALAWRRREMKRKKMLQLPSGLPVLCKYGDLHRATNGFSESLGRGGFGSVYKGALPDGSIIAVKKLEGLGRQGEKQFRTEVAAMAAVQHVNVVSLRGFCCHRLERLLVYDFLPNGSLDSHLLPKSSSLLEWRKRFQIALDVARGLEYLHEKCREKVIHCDVKPENVLLDKGFRARVADFGMAKLMGREFSRVLTTMRGTVGYLAPEWLSGSPITEKADVYGYGMMLFEITSGRRNMVKEEEEEEEEEGGREGSGFFPMWAARSVVEDGAVEVGTWKGDEVDVGEFRRACRVACWCVQDEEEWRPPMGEVVQMLEGVAERGAPLIPKNLRNLVPDEDSLVSKLSLYSLVDLK